MSLPVITISNHENAHTFPDDHSHGFRRDDNGIVDLGIVCTSAGTGVARIRVVRHRSDWWRGGMRRWRSSSSIALDDLQDKLLGLFGRFATSDEIDWTEAVDALALRSNVDMAATTLLEVADGLAPSADDQADSTIRNHDLNGALPFADGWLA